MTTTLIEGGYLLPMTGPEHIHADGAVLIEDDRIAFAGPRTGLDIAGLTIDQRIDATGRAVLPGLINTHTHIIGGYIKALTEDVSGQADAAGLYTRGIPVATSVSEDDYYWGAMTHAMEMLRTGTTTISNTWRNEHLAGPVVAELGIRAVLSEMIFETDITALSAGQMERPWDPDMVARGLDAARELRRVWHGAEGGRITTRISPAGPGYTSAAGIERCRDLAAELGVGLNIHLAELPGETEFVMQQHGVRPVELMRERGIMGPDTIAFHCVFLSQQDIEIFAETGTKLSHTAYHVAKRGYFPPMEAVYAAEVDVSLGSDWCSNDLWNFMRAAILIPRARSGDVGMLSGYDALELATGGGARGLGLAHEIGSLEPGKKADIILVDVDTPWCRPLRTENLAANLVFNAQGGDVTDVFVDGRRIVQDRIIKTIDQAAVLAEVQVRAEKIWSAAAETWT